MTLPNGYDKNSSSERVVSSRNGKVAQIIGIILLVSGGLILLASLEASAAAVLFIGIFLVVIGVLIIIRTGRKNKGQATIEPKSHSKAKHGLVLFLYFVTALAFCYGLYSQYWMAGQSLIESMGLGLILLIIGADLDERFGTILWIRDIFSNRKKKEYQ
jgi:uncharacterized membrane protein HdeD (DUF308 family)